MSLLHTKRGQTGTINIGKKEMSESGGGRGYRGSLPRPIRAT